MIHSMTAFARADASPAGLQLAWEIRSVNHRYLELSFKLPDALRGVEPELRNRLRGALQRGKVECTLRLVQGTGQTGALDEMALAELIAQVQQVRSRIDCAPPDPLALLAWPGVLGGQTAGGEALEQAALAGFDQALAQLAAARGREGAALHDLLMATLDQVERVAGEVRTQLPGIVAAHHQRLRDRVAQLAQEADPQRLEQELVILAHKSDVTEELDRLVTHVAEVRRTLTQGGPCGRRLDFLMQELNREANTLSSKSLASDTTQAAVELKVLIEQMREQIQNIE